MSRKNIAKDSISHKQSARYCSSVMRGIAEPTVRSQGGTTCYGQSCIKPPTKKVFCVWLGRFGSYQPSPLPRRRHRQGQTCEGAPFGLRISQQRSLQGSESALSPDALQSGTPWPSCEASGSRPRCLRWGCRGSAARSFRFLAPGAYEP